MLPNDATLPVPDGAYVRIAVRDHGVGIRPEDLARIFDPYFTTKVGGSGLGLTICHVIVRNHGGHLTAESRLGEGTTFLVYLPASQNRAHASDHPAPGVVPGKGRVLVVDDDRAIREVSELMLEYLGYEVRTAPDGDAAIVAYRSAMASSQRFDAVVLDLTMPGGLSGDATLAQLLAIDPNVVGIVASGYSEDPVMIERARYGFRGAVAKPFRIEELSQVLAGAMRGATS
jgi:CheY-like chemotaxis protein